MFFFEENFSLSDHNTFGIYSVARYFASFTTVDDLRAIFARCRALGVDSYKVLGGGSNMIFTGDFSGIILHCTDESIAMDQDGLVIASAGAEWDRFVEATVEQFSLQGLENLSGIPGSVGASPVQNIGAYGVEAGDRVEWVEYYDPLQDSVERIAGSDCLFGYRSSIFKSDLAHVVVLRVAYRLNRSDTAAFRVDYGDVRAEVERLGGVSAANIRRAVIAIRSSKLPDPKVLGNAGSFFKNPVVSVEHFERLKIEYPDMPSYTVSNGVKIPAGWLIDHAGLKGMRQGSVGVHEHQALVIVNYGRASADDILSFAAKIEATVYEKYGIRVEKEVTVV